ncbi:MAG: Calx-beta domain-containing protein [Euryarchaeota archaeon]|nr:Calx-beta domain-containing protein [Euryarchaeota archaeon]
MTRTTDTGQTNGDRSRYSNVFDQLGEPYGELGLVTQQDHGFWQDQSGPPTDPQAGNIPGGRRDILRTADFDNRTMDAFSKDVGIFTATGGQLAISSETQDDVAAAVFVLDDYLPSYYEVMATFNLDKPTGGWKSNGYVIFDYYNDVDFKFAGINVSTNKIEMGYVDELGWHYVERSTVPVQIKPKQNYTVTVAVNGNNVTVAVAGVNWFTYDYEPRYDAMGEPIPLNQGMVGVGMDGSSGLMDNFTVQILPPDWTFDETDDFTPPAEVTRMVESGDWNEAAGILTGMVKAESPAVQLFDLGTSLSSNNILEMEVDITTDGISGYIFDRYDADNYKFVGLDPSNDQLIIGHATSKNGIVIDATFARDLESASTYRLKVKLQGAGIEVSIDNVPVTSYGFNAALTDGDFGLLVLEGMSDFESLSLRTDDPDLAQPEVPNISIGDVTLSEGDSGQAVAVLPVTLSETMDNTVTVNFTTIDGSAAAGEDFIAVSGALTFEAGETSKNITILVNGDMDFESDETFSVLLSDAVGVELGDATGLVTIVNDDVSTMVPIISITGVQADEGDKANKTKVDVTITLSEEAITPVTVNLATQDGSAVSVADYVAVSDTVTFAPGELSKTYTLTINGDKVGEPDEEFYVVLSGAVGAEIGDDTGVVTILNDDGAYLMAAAAPDAAINDVPSLTDEDLAPIMEEAINRWTDIIGIDDRMVALLYEVSFEIVDFQDLTLGLATPDTIYIDIDAAGYGWFVDETPEDDAEFSEDSSEADGKMDLLTVVMHELGHVLGYEDLSEAEDPDALMSEALDAGERVVPGVAESEDASPSLVLMDVPMEDEVSMAAPASNGHQKSWLVDFVSDSVKSRYNPFDPREDIQIVIPIKEKE